MEFSWNFQSKYIEMEWQAAIQEEKNIIPVFVEFEDVPSLIKPYLGVHFNIENISDNVVEIYNVILKALGLKSD